MAFGLNEQRSVISELLPLLYFSQSLEQTKLREDQQAQQTAQQREAMALRQHEETRQREAFTLSKAELAAKILPDLPLDQQETLFNETIAKPFGLAPQTQAQIQSERKQVEDFRASLSTVRDPQARMQNLKSFIGTLRSRSGRAEASALGEEIIGQAAGEAIIPEQEGATPAEQQRTTSRRNFIALLPRKEQGEFLKTIMTSKTVADNESIVRVIDLRDGFDRGEITPQSLNEEAVRSAALNLPAYSPVAQDYRNTVGRQMVAQKFSGEFTNQVQRVDRGLAQLQPVEARGSLKSLDALNEQIAYYERRGVDSLNLTETYALTRMKEQRENLNRIVLQSGMGLDDQKREQAVQKIRQDLAKLDPAIANLKRQKGVPGAESQQHAFEAVRDAWKVQLEAITNPTSRTVEKLRQSREVLANEQTFWTKELGETEKKKDRLTRTLIRSGQDKALTVQAEKDAIAQGQQELVALPKAQQTPQKAGEIAARLSEETGVPVAVDDITKAAKDPNRAPIEVNMGGKMPEAIEKMAQESKAGAESALSNLDTANRIDRALKSGKVTVGPTATIRNKAAQFAQLLGVTGKDTEEQLVNTRNVIRGMAQFAVGARKALKGQGQVSDFEGKLLIKAEAGDIEDMTLPELKSFVAVTRRLADRQYKGHQDFLKTMRDEPDTAKFAKFFRVGEIPKSDEPEPPPRAGGLRFQDPEKERRYQDWKAQQNQ